MRDNYKLINDMQVSVSVEVFWFGSYYTCMHLYTKTQNKN